MLRAMRNVFVRTAACLRTEGKVYCA